MIFFQRVSIRLVLVLLTIVGTGGCDRARESSTDSQSTSQANSMAELPKVATAKPVKQSLLQKTEQPGRIEAYSTTHIHAKVAGFLDQLLVDIGDQVKGPKRDGQGNIQEPGQLLAVLVAPELKDELLQKSAMISQADADIEQAKAAVQVAESIAISAEANIEESAAGQQRSESEYQRWKSESQRINELAASKTVTQKLADETNQQLKAADAARAETTARIRSAKAKLNEAKVGITKSKADLRSIEAKRQNADAEFHRVQSLCEYLQIRAPYDGVITQRNFDAGALVQVSRSSDDKPMFTIVQMDRVRICMEVPETEAIMVEPGRNAVVKVPALGGKTFSGTVARTGWALQSGTRTLRCEMEVVNENGSLRPGMYGNVELTVAQRTDVWTLPKSAIVTHDGQPACMTVTTDGTLVRKGIQTGIRSTTDIEIVSGLDGLEDVIVANAAAFKDGQKVAK